MPETPISLTYYILLYLRVYSYIPRIDIHSGTLTLYSVLTLYTYSGASTRAVRGIPQVYAPGIVVSAQIGEHDNNYSLRIPAGVLLQRRMKLLPVYVPKKGCAEVYCMYSTSTTGHSSDQ